MSSHKQTRTETVETLTHRTTQRILLLVVPVVLVVLAV
jgi:hypothetical protein